MSVADVGFPLAVQGVSKEYGSLRALEGITFSVPRGEIVGLVGRNGAGKSTLIRILAGCIPASTGSVRVEGVDVRGNPRAATRRVGYFPERAPLYPEMRVSGFLRFAAELKGIPSGERRRAVQEALSLCGLEGVADRICGNLSRGYRQRTCLAQALLGDPSVLLLDEFTVGLDPEQVAGTRELVRKLGGRRTILLSSHMLVEVESLCDRVLLLDHGRILACGRLGELRRQVGREARFRVRLAGRREHAAEAELELRGLPGVTRLGRTELPGGGVEYLVEGSDEDRFPKALQSMAHTTGLLIRELSSTEPALEEVFLKLLRRH